MNPGMRPCVFLVPDKNIEKLVTGFLTRSGFHQSLNCRPFAFNPVRDMLVDPGRDPHIYKRADGLLQPFASTHQHAVVLVDAAWGGSPGEKAIKMRVQQHIIKAGWPDGKGCAIVLVPEVEAWIWQNSPHVLAALGVKESYESLQKELESRGFWKQGDIKPHAPKEAMEFILRRNRKPRSSAIYEQIARSVSLRKCINPSLQQLLTCLRHWFPAS